jgi:hypothetical protein
MSRKAVSLPNAQTKDILRDQLRRLATCDGVGRIIPASKSLAAFMAMA